MTRLKTRTMTTMTRRKQLTFAFTLAGLLVALALAIGLGRPRPATICVVSIRRAVPAGTALNLDDLALVDLPVGLATPAYLDSQSDAVGMAPLHDLHAGQLLERGWLREHPAGIAYPDAAPAARLYTLKLKPEQANGFWLAVGNRVDVHLVPRSDASIRNDALLPDMLPAIKIAALIGADGDAAHALSVVGGQTDASPLVCLAVSATEARVLALAEASCTIKLVPLNEPVSESESVSHPVSERLGEATDEMPAVSARA